jgi:hypothetical protein
MKKLLLVPLFILLLVVGYVYWFYYSVYSDGSREGVLMKISRKGNIFKTYEAEILQPGFRSGSGAVMANTFKFSVVVPEVAKQLETVAGQTVKVHYVQYRRALPWRGDNYDTDNAESGQYIVTELLKSATTPVAVPHVPEAPIVPLLPNASTTP